MSINVGELVATMRLDDAQFGKALRDAPGNARTALSGVTEAATTEGQKAGRGLAKGIDDGLKGAASGSAGASAALAGVGDAGITQGARAGRGLADGVTTGVRSAVKEAGKGGQEAGQSFVRSLFNSPFVAEVGKQGRQAGSAIGKATADAAEETGPRMNAAGQQVGLQFTGGVKAVLVQVGALFAGAKILDFIVQTKDAASDLTETMSKAGTVFGSEFARIETWAGNAAKAMGLSKQAALESASSFGNMFQQLGIAGDQAADMSMKVVQMAADFGSFNNLPTAEVLDKISGAFRGEYDSIQQIIPTMSAARVEQEAMTETGKKSASQLTASEKAMAVLAIATRDGANQLGDYAKTADGVSNTEKTLAAQFEETKAALGERLMPAWEAFLGLLSGAVGVLAGVLGPVADMVVWFTELPGPVQAGALAFAAWTLAIQPAIAKMLGFIAASGGVTAAAGRVGASLLAGFGGPIGIAILGVTAAIGFFMSQTSEAETVVTNFGAALDENTGQLAANSEAALSAALAESGHLQLYKAIKGDVADYTGALRGLAPEQDRVHTSILDAAEAALKGTDAWTRMTGKGLELSSNSRQVASDILATGDAGKYSSEGMTAALAASSAFASDLDVLATEAEKAAVATEATAAGAGAVAAAVVDSTTPMQDLAAATKDLEAASSGADTATRFLAAALIELGGGTVEATAAARNQESALRDIGSAARDVAEAQAEQDAATTALSQAQAEFGAGSAEAAAAQRELDNAADGVADALDDQYGTSIRARDGAADLAGRAFDAALANGTLEDASKAASSVIEEQRHKFINAAMAAGTEEQAAYSLAQELFGIPGDVETLIRERGAAVVQAEAGKTTGAIDGIPDSNTTNLNVNDNATSIVRNLAGELRALNGYSAWTTVGTRYVTEGNPSTKISTPGTGGQHLGGVPGYAGGGAMPNRGAYTVDGLLIKAHRDEHMLDAGDVGRIGGQAATYAFRNALTAGGPSAAAAMLARLGNSKAMAPAGSSPMMAPASSKAIEFTGPMYFPAGTDHRALINHAIRESLR